MNHNDGYRSGAARLRVNSATNSQVRTEIGAGAKARTQEVGIPVRVFTRAGWGH